MKATGQKDTKTQRIKTLTLTPHTASDELLLTHLYQTLANNHPGQIIITHINDNPNQAFTWQGEPNNPP